MRRPGRPVALAAPLLVWGGLHVAGPSVWTLGVLAVAAFAAFWVDHGDDRRLTRPADLWFVPAIFWCAGSTAAGWFGVQGQPWWLLPAILGPVTLWWWVAVALWWPRPAPPDDDPEPEPEPDLPDEPPVRTITVVDRTPLPEPLSAHRPVRVVTLRAVPQLIDITPDRDPDDEDEDGADDGLPARLVQVWPERRKTRPAPCTSPIWPASWGCPRVSSRRSWTPTGEPSGCPRGPSPGARRAPRRA